MPSNTVTYDRRRADDAERELIKSQIASVGGAVANLSDDHQETKKSLGEHMKSCAKLQRIQLVGLAVTFGYLFGHGPEAKAIAELFVKALLP